MTLLAKWIGLAHVRPRESCDLLEGALGAFVTVVAMATDDEDFAGAATKMLEAFGFHVIEVDDIEPWSVRVAEFAVADDIQKLVESLTRESPIAFGTFNSYEAE